MRNTRLVLGVAAATTALLAVTAGIVGAVIVFGGFYDIAATGQHWQATYTLLQRAKHHSVERHARDIEEPSLDDARALRGAGCFRDKCVQCHGAPGVARDEIARSIQPLPPPLVDARDHWRARELYWVTRNGLRMTAMPGWEFRLHDDEIWDLVAFMERLKGLTAARYADWARRAPPPPACGAGSQRPDLVPVTVAAIPPDLERGRTALYQYACNACHVIPGVTGAKVYVGPPLAGIGGRTFIAGTLFNTPDAMARWLMHTQQVKPGTAMPEMGVDERDARDMAGYLATLR